MKRANALAGKCACRPPYGYKAVSGGNHTWEVDEEAAETVREIFRRVIAGDGPFIIGKDFEKRNIDPPLVYYRKRKGLPLQNDSVAWPTSVISTMCENRAYIGQLVSQKTTRQSYKNHKIVYRPEDDWVVIDNHHTPIIDMETFETVQKLRANRRRPTKMGDMGALSGLIFCADCSSKLAISRNTAKRDEFQYYICSGYRNSHNRHYAKCSRHSIKRKDIEAIVHEKIVEVAGFVRKDKVKFAEAVQKATTKDNARAVKHKTAELSKAERRNTELDKIIKRLYEDNVAGRLNDERFMKFLADFETEQSELESDIAALRMELDEIKNKTANLESFIELVSRHTEITELTAEVARTFIDKVVVHEAVYKENSRIKLSQEVTVIFNCIGEFVGV